MSDPQWCITCGFHVSLEDLEDCQDKDCPLHMPIVDVGDELHKILGEALAVSRPHLSPPEK